MEEHVGRYAPKGHMGRRVGAFSATEFPSRLLPPQVKSALLVRVRLWKRLREGYEYSTVRFWVRLWVQFWVRFWVRLREVMSEVMRTNRRYLCLNHDRIRHLRSAALCRFRKPDSVPITRTGLQYACFWICYPEVVEWGRVKTIGWILDILAKKAHACVRRDPMNMSVVSAFESAYSAPS